MTDRLIGTCEIQPAFQALYGQTTWEGVRAFIKKHGIPLFYLPNGKPCVLCADLIKFDEGFREVIPPARQ